MVEVQAILESLSANPSRLYEIAIQDMLVAIVFQNGPALKDARARLNDAMRETLGIAELLGAMGVLKDAAPIAREEGLAFKHDAPALMVFASTPTQTLLPKVTFTEALEDLLARTPTTLKDAATRTFQNIARLYSVDSGGVPRIAFVRSAEEAVTLKAQRTIAEAIEQGIPEGDFIQGGVVQPGAGRRISEAVDAVREIGSKWSQSYSKMAFRTNLNTAVTAGKFRQARDPDIKKVMPAVMFDAVNDGDVRPNHVAGDGLIFLSDNKIWLTHAPPLDYGCYLPGTRISGRFERASKANYSGPAVEIHTKLGGRFAVTVNHPVLTPAGWKPAGSLAEGDDLFSDLRTIKALDSLDSLVATFVSTAGGAEDDEHMPPCAEDVFETLRAHGAGHGAVSCARPSPLDFHGDGRFLHGDIDIVSTDGVLPDWDHAAVSKEERDIAFMGSTVAAQPASHSESGPGDGLLAAGDASGSLPGSGALSLDNSLVVGAALSAAPLQSLSFSTPANSHVLTPEASHDSAATEAEFVRELLEAHPGEIAPDSIVEIRQFDFSGHVYDFQSVNGWMLAGGSVTSNCRCGVRLIGRPELRRRNRLNADGTVKESTAPSKWHAAPGFRTGNRPDLGIENVVS